MPYAKLDQAMLKAAKWHAGSFRDGEDALPYLTHPVEVLVHLRVVGSVTDEEILCAGILHDVLEDTDGTREEILALFGARVADLVQEMTRHEPSETVIANMSKDEIWELRSKILLDEISKMSPDCATIKLADRLSNIREAKRVKSGEKKKRYIKQTKRILELIPRSVNPGLWDAVQDEVD